MAALLPLETEGSSVALAVYDVNGDGLDDVVRSNLGFEVAIHLQAANGDPMPLFRRFDTSSGLWSLTLGHLTGQELPDIAVGHSNRLRLYQATDPTADYLLADADPDIFVQGLNLVDIDNDGELNVFACHDVGLSRAYDWTGSSLVANPSLINPVSTIPSDNSGNYSSTWTDYDDDGDLDLYLAKCRGFVNNPLDGRRVNQLFRNDGNGNWTDVAEAAGLRPLRQSWSATFGDLDNDGDQDAFIINHDGFSQLLRNDEGVFTDVTSPTMQVELAGSGGWQVAFADLNNDGLQDIIHSGEQHGLVIYRNDGEWAFTRNTESDVNRNSFAVGDLNNDGALDLLTSSGFLNSGGPVRDGLLINNGNDHHHLKLRLTGTSSHVDAIGARTYLHGEWGVQTREVRAGESYGIQHSATQHFGLGAETMADSLVIVWPSGLREKLINVGADQTLELVEGAVATLPAELTVFTAESTKDGDLLRWSVVEQRDVAHYAVERSPDGRQFTTVATVTAGPAPTADYQQLTAPLPADRFYRLRTVDRDGSSQLSEVRFLGETDEGISAYPNPVYDRLTLTLPAPARVVIRGTDGRRMLDRPFPAGRSTLSVAKWPTGTSLLSVGRTVRRLVVSR